MKYTILVIEDDKSVLKLVKTALSKDGFNVVTVTKGTVGMDIAQEMAPDLIVLDLNLPDIDGLEVCRFLKKNEQTKAIPVIMLSARTKTEEKIIGLRTGADDYLAKPFSPRELSARVDVVLKRVLWKGEPEEVIDEGNLNINFTTHVVKVKGKIIELTKKEFDLLSLFLRKKGKVLNENFLLESVWGYYTYISSKTLDVHVSKLRKKLGPKIANKIVTVRGVGYKFC